MLKQELKIKQIQKLTLQQIQLMKLIQIPITELEQRIKEELVENPLLEIDEDKLNNEDNFETITPQNETNEIEDENEVEEKFYDDEFIYENTTIENIDTENSDDNYSNYDNLNDDNNIYFDDNNYHQKTQNRDNSNEQHEKTFLSNKTFHESLIEQVNLRYITPIEKEIAKVIIGEIDDDGYLKRDISLIVDDLAFYYNIDTTKEEVEKVLSIIQDLDPPGIGARDLKECLLLQLKNIEKQTQPIKIAKQIISKHYDDFINKHYNKIITKLKIEEELFQKALSEILKLNPKPGNSLPGLSKNEAIYVIPDFILTINNNTIEVSISNKNIPPLRINQDYAKLLQKESKSNKETVNFVKKKITEAEWFIESINQRNNTLYSIINVIVKYQYEFFLTGDYSKIKPMVLQDIANITQMDISTVSRAVKDKYIETPFGTYALKKFFSESLTTDSGEEISTTQIKQLIIEIISTEDKTKPVTDKEIADILKKKGYNVARRTIAKYREQLNIPVARMRKTI